MNRRHFLAATATATAATGLAPLLRAAAKAGRPPRNSGRGSKPFTKIRPPRVRK